MVVEAFEIDTGFYAFAASDLQTSWHAHPVDEIVIANSGSFTLEYGEQVFTGLHGGIIPANLRHRLTAVDSQLMICMIEAPAGIDWPKASCSPLTDERGALMIQHPANEQWTIARLRATHLQAPQSIDERVKYCLERLPERLQDPRVTAADLAAEVHLSPGRLSHLFKSEVGVSLSKYLLWVRLRTAINSYLSGNMRLLDAALTAGFYDAAHFSRVFREMLGEKPSFAYNSNSVQD